MIWYDMIWYELKGYERTMIWYERIIIWMMIIIIVCYCWLLLVYHHFLYCYCLVLCGSVWKWVFFPFLDKPTLYIYMVILNHFEVDRKWTCQTYSHFGEDYLKCPYSIYSRMTEIDMLLSSIIDVTYYDYERGYNLSFIIYDLQLQQRNNPDV